MDGSPSPAPLRPLRPLPIDRIRRIHASRYFPAEKLRPTGDIVRSTFLMRSPIPNTMNAPSCQIILPANQVRQSVGLLVQLQNLVQCSQNRTLTGLGNALSDRLSE